MLEPDELAQRLIAELEEAGFDELHGLLNAVIAPTGSPNELETYKHALEAITRNGHGYLCFERMRPPELHRLNDDQTTEFLNRLPDWFRFERSSGYWMLGNGDPLNDRYPVIFLTHLGVEKARKVLETRGYHWWSPRVR